MLVLLRQAVSQQYKANAATLQTLSKPRAKTFVENSSLPWAWKSGQYVISFVKGENKQKGSGLHFQKEKFVDVTTIFLLLLNVKRSGKNHV